MIATNLSSLLLIASTLSVGIRAGVLSSVVGPVANNNIKLLNTVSTASTQSSSSTTGTTPTSIAPSNSIPTTSSSVLATSPLVSPSNIAPSSTSSPTLSSIFTSTPVSVLSIAASSLTRAITSSTTLSPTSSQVCCYTQPTVWVTVYSTASSTTSSTASTTTSSKSVPTCTPSSFGNSTLDDTPAIASAFQTCGNGGMIVFPYGSTYSINSALSFSGCQNCEIRLEGTLKVSSNLTYWNGRKSFLSMSGINNAIFRSKNGTGMIDGSGQAYYDYYNTDSTYSRPTLLYITGYSTNITMSNINFINAPSTFLSVTGYSSNCNFQNINMKAISTSQVVPKNTDGMDIGYSTNVTLNNIIISNQDDCVAFKPGADHVTITNIYCSGSHGISVGSLGSKAGQVDSVTNIYVYNATMVDSTKAVGIKLYDGSPNHGSAIVRNVTYDTVTVNGCGYAAQIQSCYSSTSAATCNANPSSSNVTDVYFKNFSGMLGDLYSKTVVANIDCPGNGTCDVFFSNFTAKPASGGSPTYLCSNIDNANPGITCGGAASG